MESPWRSLLLSRVLQALPVLLLTITVTFFMVRLAPGDPFDNERFLPPEVQAQLRADYNLDAPLFNQYLHFLGQLATFDLGPSFRYPNRSVSEIIATGLPVTLELGLYAMSIALLVGIGAGVFSATKPYALRDRSMMLMALVGICVPSFVLGPLLALLFGIQWQWLPVTGWGYTPGDKILPSLTLGIGYAAYIARLPRGGMLEMFTQDFIRTARAKGLSEGRILIKHALPGGLLPVISYLGPATAGLLSGSFVIETIFQIPGLGRFFVQGAFNRDYTLIMGMTIFFAVLIILMNLLSDLLAALIDPRQRQR